MPCRAKVLLLQFCCPLLCKAAPGGHYNDLYTHPYSLMRRNIPFVLFLATLSALSGWLMSHMSFIGRVGVNLFHKEYRFLKVWYEGGGVVFGVLLLLFLLQWLADSRLRRSTATAIQCCTLLLAGGGLWLTYSNFRSDFTHSILKERFHLGAYLFWIGWISISLFLLATRRIQQRSDVEIERV